MKHIYQNIPGWFTYPRLYKDMITKFPSGSHFVEVGIFEGKSLAYLIIEIINAKKDIIVTAVDSFEGIYAPGFISGIDLYNKFCDNLKPLQNKFNLVRDKSWSAADGFADKSLDFVFIDAAHDYVSVKKDILAWLPKVKDDGIIAGHDYPSDVGVREAVDEIFGEINNREYVDEDCWTVMKKIT